MRTSCHCSSIVCMIIHVLLYQYRNIESVHTCPHITDTEEGNQDWDDKTGWAQGAVGTKNCSRKDKSRNWYDKNEV